MALTLGAMMSSYTDPIPYDIPKLNLGYNYSGNHGRYKKQNNRKITRGRIKKEKGQTIYKTIVVNIPSKYDTEGNMLRYAYSYTKKVFDKHIYI